MTDQTLAAKMRRLAEDMEFEVRSVEDGHLAFAFVRTGHVKQWASRLRALLSSVSPTQPPKWSEGEAKAIVAGIHREMRSLDHMIRCAPKLLAALQGLLSDGALDVALMDQERISIARAAIAEATSLSPAPQKDEDDHTRGDGFPGVGHGDLPRLSKGDK